MRMHSPYLYITKTDGIAEAAQRCLTVFLKPVWMFRQQAHFDVI